MDKTPQNSEKVRVVTSSYPLHHFVSQIGGDFASVTSFPTGLQEPHSYEPKPKEIAFLYTSDLFIYNGAGLEKWAERLENDLVAKNIRVINMSTHFNLLQNNDPHIWLDPLLVQQQILIIRDVLSEIDPLHADDYAKAGALYNEEINKLHADFEQGLKNCKKDTIIASHNAFQYLANRYGFELLAIRGISSEEEPSSRHIASVLRIAKEKNITYIFTEPWENSGFVNTLAEEIGGDVLILDPLEIPDQVGNDKGEVGNDKGEVGNDKGGVGNDKGEVGSETGEDSYLARMRNNVRAIKIALDCT